MSVFYRPDDGFAADFIPFYRDGEYHLFYLKDYRNVERHGEGTPWWHVVTRDFVNFEDRGEVLARGTREEQDLYVFTGCVIEGLGQYHIFYTGHNQHLKERGEPQEAVMHAVSADLDTWHKQPGERFFAPSDAYEPHDWRDPFVFWHEEANEWRMLLAARKRNGPDHTRGLVAQAGSTDLMNWEIREPFWAPDLYYTHECPDLFSLTSGGTHRYYLVWSEFSDRMRTCYRMAESIEGPWLKPADDLFDDRAYYAAKTAGTEHERYLFGWLPTRENETDTGNWQWGGRLVVHEIYQIADGSLAVRCPRTVNDAFNKPLPLEPAPRLGCWNIEGAAFSTSSVGRYSVLSLGTYPCECMLRFDALCDCPAGAYGAILRADDEIERYYELQYDPVAERLSFNRYPRMRDRRPLVERPLHINRGESLELKVIVDGSCVVAYANDRVALSCRMYDFSSTGIGLFGSECNVRFSGVGVSVRQ